MIYDPLVHAHKLIEFYGTPQSALAVVRGYSGTQADETRHFELVASELERLAKAVAR
jgi:hypothetical protein